MKIVLNNGDGTVTIRTPAEKSKHSLEEIAEMGGKPYRIVDVSAIPGDRTFRGAWTDDNPTETVDVDIPRAKLIAHEVRRKHRDGLMEPLDRRATVPTEFEQVELIRQGIREENAATQARIDKAKTEKELKEAISWMIEPQTS